MQGQCVISLSKLSGIHQIYFKQYVTKRARDNFARCENLIIYKALFQHMFVDLPSTIAEASCPIGGNMECLSVYEVTFHCPAP